MAEGTSVAVTEATRLGEIGFPEFTAKLVTDVFDALVAANLRQTEAYQELLAATAKTLSSYLNDTRDDISGELVLQFLAAVAPPAPGSDAPTAVVEGATLDDDTRTALDAALALPDEDGLAQPAAVPGGALDRAGLDAIYTAVANRIAADKYSLLKEMVKLGILRLVVENGLIETRLTFTTYGSSFAEANSSQYNRSAFAFRAKARTGALLSKWVDASASTSYRSVSVRTANETSRDTSGSQVQIFGRVEIRFKTDYLSLG